MSKNRTLKQMIFLALIALSAILLCFVGVYAAENAFKPKIYSNVAPDVICKLTSGATTIFDNTNGTHSTSDDDNKPLKETYNATAGTKLTFTLTNYTTDKNVRVSIKSGGSTVCTICADAKGTSATAKTSDGEWTPTSGTTYSVVIEKVNKVEIKGEGLTDTTQYFASYETPEISLTPAVGYQLPQKITMSSSDLACTGFNVTNNREGVAEFDNHITGDGTLTCNCEKVFTICKSDGTSMFEEDATEAMHAASGENLLPNNGDYTVSETTYTKGPHFKEYKYYVEMGYYPQTLVAISAKDSKDEFPIPTGYALTSGDIYHSTNTDDTNSYLWSPINVIPNSIGLTFESTKITSTNASSYYGMFKLEPIIWTVVGAKNRDSDVDVLSTLHYEDNMLCTDDGDFTGELELLSAYGLDTSVYQTPKSDGDNPKAANYNNSTIDKELQVTDGLFDKTGNILNATAHFADLGGNYISKKILTTKEYQNDTTLTTDNNDPFTIFLLSKGETLTTTENYKFGDYFKNGVAEVNAGTTYSLAVAPLSDYAIARGAETSLHADTTQNPQQYAVKTGWQASTTTTPNTSNASCAYWLRTAGTSDETAYLINLNGVVEQANTADANICIRPFIVLNMAYYHNSTNKYYNNTYEPLVQQTQS